jgi:calcium-activated chloride channel regulator 1/calcium-activated chloride channel regulator 4
MAVEDSRYLNNVEGNAIILLTDGRQTKDCTYNYQQAEDKLVNKKIRLITIALGDKADEEIEGLALATGGKPYFVDDNSGPGDFSDAFTGSTTFQPADTISNTDVTIYQNTWDYKETLTDAFDIDASIGRDLTFRLEVKNGNANCQQDMTISLIEPDPNNRIDESFKCSKSNFGTFIHKLQNNATVGKWSFSVKTSEKYDSLTVRITSKSRSSSTDPIQTKCWIKSGEQELGKEVYLKLSAVAEVKQGNKPVIGARVRAYITRPSDGGVNPPLEMELWDNGSGESLINNFQNLLLI